MHKKYTRYSTSKVGNQGASKNSEFAQMQGAGKILVPANLKVTLH